ncbi:MAG: hypothetical protein LLF76_00170 [Planctomycetaceae bacterium]|nr:hypothetical protein [Planctomycetaceae bacterium]
MESHKQKARVLLVCIFTALSFRVEAAQEDWVVLCESLPQDVLRINIPLTFTASQARFYSSSSQELKSRPIEDARKKDDFKHELDLGTAVDGNAYVLLIAEPTDVTFINRQDDFKMMKLLSISDKKTRTVLEGLTSLGNDLEIPLEVLPERIAVPSDRPVKGNMRIDVYGRGQGLYEARVETNLYGTLSGKASTDKVLLEASVTCCGTPDLKERCLNLSVKPFDEAMAAVSCNGKLSDTLMLGSAKVVVEKAASDGSELVLAVLGGSLVQEKRPGDTLVAIGKPFPDFARVELIKHQLITLGDLKKEAGSDGFIVLIFGDLKVTMHPAMMMGGPSRMRTLSLDEAMIADILKKDCDQPVLINFFCQQFSISALYEKWLGQTPEFHVFSDFSNPLNVQFVSGDVRQPMYGPPQPGESLRGSLRFPDGNVITALLDGSGGLLYVNTDAGGELAASLVQINTLIKERKKPQTQD